MAPTIIPRSPSCAAEGEALREAIRRQVEYYFSRQNLAQDPYLVSQMNSQLYVPLTVISNFKLVKSLTEDPVELLEALKTSTSVSLDPTNTMLKPNIKQQRNTLILRDIAADTNSEV